MEEESRGAREGAARVLPTMVKAMGEKEKCFILLALDVETFCCSVSSKGQARTYSIYLSPAMDLPRGAKWVHNSLVQRPDRNETWWREDTRVCLVSRVLGL